MCYNDEHNCNSIGTKNIAISLKELLKIYCNYTSELKDEIHQLMSSIPDLWKKRPLSDKLIYYAGCDVKYLPKVYDAICIKCEKRIYKNITIEKILEECKKYLKYLDINKDIKKFSRIYFKKGTKLLGLIKNFQQKCVFVQLNIGYIGIVSGLNSVSKLKTKYKLGDIIEFQILEIENDKKRLILDIYNSKEQNFEIEEEKNKINESNNKIKHASLNINKKSFYPKSFLNRNHGLNPYSSMNNNSINTNSKFYYENQFNNNINNQNSLQINDYFYNNKNLTSNLNLNDGWLYNEQDNNAFYYEQPDENNSSNFYYVINRFQDGNQGKYAKPYK